MSISLFRQSSNGSAWQTMEAWRAKQKQYTADFEAVNSTLMSNLMDVFTSSNDGQFELTVNKALAAAQARVEERKKLNPGADLSSSLSDLGANLDLTV